MRRKHWKWDLWMRCGELARSEASSQAVGANRAPPPRSQCVTLPSGLHYEIHRLERDRVDFIDVDDVTRAQVGDIVSVPPIQTKIGVSFDIVPFNDQFINWDSKYGPYTVDTSNKQPMLHSPGMHIDCLGCLRDE